MNLNFLYELRSNPIPRKVREGTIQTFKVTKIFVIKLLFSYLIVFNTIESHCGSATTNPLEWCLLQLKKYKQWTILMSIIAYHVCVYLSYILYSSIIYTRPFAFSLQHYFAASLQNGVCSSDFDDIEMREERVCKNKKKKSRKKKKRYVHVYII